jgi:thiol-disulfide isomerase/thioredoxin
MANANFYQVFSQFIRPYQRHLLVLVVGIIFILIGYYGYMAFYGKTQGPLKPYSDVANANTREKPIQVYFFHVDWCPHCKTAKTDWNSFKDEYDGKSVNGQQVECIDLNCTDETDPDVRNKLSDFKIKGFPHVVLVLADGSRVVFDAKITKASLEQFIQQATV